MQPPVNRTTLTDPTELAQLAISIIITAAVVFQVVRTGQIDERLTAIMGLILGYYFGKSQAPPRSV